MTSNRSALPASSFWRALIALVTFSLLAVSLTSVAMAKPGSGNSEASAACEDGGHLDWTRADGTAFKNEGACVKYAAQGNALVGIPEFSISYRPNFSSFASYTFTWAGLEPNTTLLLTWTSAFGDVWFQGLSSNNTVGAGSTTGIANCFTFIGGYGSAAVTATPAGGTSQVYPLALPDATACNPA